MKLNDRNDSRQAKLENIRLDLSTYKILLYFQNHTEPLVIHFDKPARRFYFSLIALVIIEMKNLDKPKFIHIRKHEKTLKLLDNSLAGPNASKTSEGMWDKIRKSWRYTLPDLETGTHFKILDRNLIQPYERGGKHRYDCSDDECDIWSNLFGYDENNPWRFKFAIDSVSLSLNDISVALGDLRENSAWQEFVHGLSHQPKPVSREKRAVSRWWKKAVFSLVAISIIIAVILVIWNSYIRTVPPTTEFDLPDKPSIAVLPFVNMSGDPKQEYLSDGLTDEVIANLSNVPKLFVIARNSTFTYKNKSVMVQQVAEELGVKYVLEGSVRKAGDKMRITVQLIDALSGHHLWAEQYDRDLKDIFAVQDEITKKIITAMQVKLTEGEQARAVSKGTNNLEAYLKCLQANEYINRVNIEGIALAKQLVEEALTLDPEYAWGYYTLGKAHLVEVWVGQSKTSKESIPEAMELFQKALVFDDTLAEAYGRIGFLYAMMAQHDKGVAEAEHGVALNPNSALARLMLGKTLSFAGRWEESIPQYKQAIRLNPIPPNIYYYSIGLSYCYMGQYEKGVIWCEKAVRREPDSLIARIMMTVAYSLSGRQEEARIEATEVLRISPEFSLEKFEKKVTYKKKTDKERFIEALQKAGLK